MRLTIFLSKFLRPMTNTKASGIRAAHTRGEISFQVKENVPHQFPISNDEGDMPAVLEIHDSKSGRIQLFGTKEELLELLEGAIDDVKALGKG